MTGTTTEHLKTYLQDHRAGAEMGSHLARRLADENLETPYEDFFVNLAQEIEQDVETLEVIMERFDVGKAVIKTAGANIGEKLGNQLTGYSPLSRVLELETLRAGVQGKLALWDSLAQVAPHDDHLDGEQIGRLTERAERQLDSLREHHQMTAREAFAPG